MALPPHFGDPLAVGDLMVDIGADMGGEGGILDPEHQLEIEEQAAHVEIGRTDMDGVVDDVELGVELGRLIFVDLDSFPQQPGIGEARRRDRGLVEIGRASCRERVCTYWSVAVVDVSLKKKTK